MQPALRAVRAVTVLTVSVGEARDDAVCEHFCLSVSLPSGKKSPMKNDKSITGREGGDGAFFIKLLLLLNLNHFIIDISSTRNVLKKQYKIIFTEVIKAVSSKVTGHHRIEI